MQPVAVTAAPEREREGVMKLGLRKGGREGGREGGGRGGKGGRGGGREGGRALTSRRAFLLAPDLA